MHLLMSHMCYNVFSKGLQNNTNLSSYIVETSCDGPSYPSNSSSDLLCYRVSSEDRSTTSTAPLLLHQNNNSHLEDPKSLPYTNDILPPDHGVPFNTKTDIIHNNRQERLQHT